MFSPHAHRVVGQAHRVALVVDRGDGDQHVALARAVGAVPSRIPRSAPPGRPQPA